MTQQALFTVADGPLGERLKREGMDAAARHNEQFLAAARKWAVDYSCNCGQLTIDDVRAWAARTGWEPDHPNVWGSVFAKAGWRCVGFKKSTWPSSRARRVAVWLYGST